jgi:hypothetical protein
MKRRTPFLLGSCAILVLSLGAKAQDFGAAAAAGGAAGAPPAAPAGANLFTMLLPPPELAERCRQKLCKCEIVKLLKQSLLPASAATGGIIPVGNCCPAIKKEDLAKPAESSEGAAARIKKDVEEAAARRVAVRYLGTVDCRYWPEAEQALIDALRADKIECVRYEAALALQRGCCCTKRIAKALTITIEGTDVDGNPAERSHRVQDAAALALSMCVFEDKSEKDKEQQQDKKGVAKLDPKEFQRRLDAESVESVHNSARKALEKRSSVSSTQVLSQSHRAGSQGLIGIFSHAVESSHESAQKAGTREYPTYVANAQPQQPQRRGLLYKLMPSSNEETVVYNVPAPVQAPQPVITQPMVAKQPQPMPSQPVVSQPMVSQPKTQPMFHSVAAPVAKQSPVLPVVAPQNRLPISNEIRPASYTTAPTYNSTAPVSGITVPAASKVTTEDIGFSTAGPSRPITPRPAGSTTSSNPMPRSEGLLGLVILNESPTRR